MGLVLTQLPLLTFPPLNMLRLSIAEATAGFFLSGVSIHTVARWFTASGFVMRDQRILVIPRRRGRQYARNTDMDGRPTTNHLSRTTTIISDLRRRSDVSTITSLILFHLRQRAAELLFRAICSCERKRKCAFFHRTRAWGTPTHARRVRDDKLNKCPSFSDVRFTPESAQGQ